MPLATSPRVIAAMPSAGMAGQFGVTENSILVMRPDDTGIGPGYHLERYFSQFHSRFP